MHWWVAAMAVLYSLSGITIVRSDEAAVVLRWGRLVGDTPALQQHGPGLLFAFPRPVDQVVRVPIKHVWEVQVKTLASTTVNADSSSGLDPLTQGYALTGDQNIVHLDMVARYRVRNPAEWAFYGPKTDILRVEVTAAMVRSLGEMPVDRVLADGRKQLIATASRRAQAGLDAAHSGLELSSLELTRLTPPAGLATDFDSVQSAFIGLETRKKEAQTYAENAIPQAQAKAAAAVQSAMAAAASDLATANGETQAFLALDREYRAQPAVVRERLYRDAVERAIGRAGTVRWVPPPIGGNYHGFRITLQPSGSRPKTGDPDEGGGDPE
ncbi:MAG TPA: SPFH domain-containing protein [Candidatus Baltobacteraceae bacterium]|nr:SPFH domain-containing protein [Candidatus Baltobacteraceae bacterium]